MPCARLTGMCCSTAGTRCSCCICGCRRRKSMSTYTLPSTRCVSGAPGRCMTSSSAVSTAPCGMCGPPQRMQGRRPPVRPLRRNRRGRQAMPNGNSRKLWDNQEQGANRAQRSERPHLPAQAMGRKTKLGWRWTWPAAAAAPCLWRRPSPPIARGTPTPERRRRWATPSPSCTASTSLPRTLTAWWWSICTPPTNGSLTRR